VDPGAHRPEIGASRRVTRAAIRLLGPALLIVLIVKMPDRGAVFAAIASASALPLALAVSLNLVNIHLKVVRWNVLLKTRGIRYPERRAWSAFMTSLYVGMLTPGRVGDVLRARYLKHDLGVPYSEGLASVVMDRFCDLYVLVAFVSVGIVHYSGVIAGKLAWITWGGVAATALGPLVLLVPGVAEKILSGAYARLARSDGAGDFHRFLEAVRANVGRPLLVTMPLTVATFAVNYIQGYLVARAMGLDMSLFDATCLLAIASLLGLLPVSISGVGVRELFFALVFPFLGFTAQAGVSFGLLVFIVIYAAIVAIGFVSWQIAPPPSGGHPTGGGAAEDRGNA
jgi:glycosyltransferase 2 family protein